MDFLTKQENIISWIKTNYKALLSEHFGTSTDLDAYITDAVDLDKYQKNKQMFINWNNYSYEALSLDSRKENIELHLLLTFRKNNAVQLHNDMMTYASILYGMIENCDGFNGEVDIVEVSNIEFYEGCYSDTSIKVADLTINLQDEIRN